MLSRTRLPEHFPIGTKYVLEGCGPFVRRYIEFPNGRRITTHNPPCSVLHMFGAATDQYCPGPECCRGRRSLVALARGRVVGECCALYRQEKCSR